MFKKKTLSERLADLTSAAPSEAFNPDAPDFDDGTGAGLTSYKDHGDVEGNGDLFAEGRPSADLRVAADMASIGQEYHGKRVSRKNLEAAWGVFGDAHDPEASEGGSSVDDEEGLDGDEGAEAGAAGTSSKRTIPSLNLDDVSSSEEEDGEEGDEGVSDRSEGDSDSDSDDDRRDEKEVAVDGEPARRREGEGGRQEQRRYGEGEEEGGVLGAGATQRQQKQKQQQQQANVFAGVGREGVDVGADVDAAIEKKMIQLARQDETAKRKRGGLAVRQGELERAAEALRQREWWDSLLEVRILLQRLMNAANKLPGPNELPLFLEGDESLTDLAKEGAGAAQALATQLSALRRSQMACWGVTTTTNDTVGTNGENARNTGPGTAMEQGEGGGEGAEAVAAREHGSCMEWWEGVLGRWHERTQLVDPSLQKKFRVVNQGPWAQVTASLADRGRANRRAFMAESETDEFLGRKLAKRLKAASNDNGNTGSAAEAAATDEGGEDGAGEILGRERRKAEAEPVDLEVIDDRDLYQHLLKEFMDASGGVGSGYGVSGGVPVRRKSRNKAVDRKASKGRKIKYVTHPKMQNFMFPQEYGPPPMEPSELFASLFGGAGNPQ